MNDEWRPVERDEHGPTKLELREPLQFGIEGLQTAECTGGVCVFRDHSMAPKVPVIVPNDKLEGLLQAQRRRDGEVRNPKIQVTLEQTLTAILANPTPMWGNSEAYELQVLMLLQLRYQLPPNVLIRRYSIFMKERSPDLGCRILSSLEEDMATLGKHLKAFRESLGAPVAEVS